MGYKEDFRTLQLAYSLLSVSAIKSAHIHCSARSFFILYGKLSTECSEFVKTCVFVTFLSIKYAIITALRGVIWTFGQRLCSSLKHIPQNVRIYCRIISLICAMREGAHNHLCPNVRASL